ncbi:MAG: glycosyltransferase [Ktedonobacterales bacterium]
MNNREIAAEIADILSLDIDEILVQVESEAARPGSNVSSAWRESNPSSDDENERFYSDSKAYIFDLMREATSEVRHQWRSAVVAAVNQHWGRATEARVLDYGAGVGSDTLYFAEQCRAAFYYDLPGVTSEFAVKRFARHKVPVTRITSTRIYGAEFDALVAFDVLEHLVDPLAHLDEMVRLTKPGGLLFLTESFDLVGENHPSHLLRNVHLSGKLDELLIERGCRPVTVLEGHINVYVKGPAVTVIVPIYNAYDHIRQQLDSVNRTTPGYPLRWILMNDASPDSRISALLHEFAASFRGVCQVVDSSENRGFPRTCNAAILESGSDDVILVNSDTILYDGWARRLLEAAYEDPAIGTATPLSNSAAWYTIFDYVTPVNRLNEMLAELEQPSVPIPIGVGFCLYVKREMLDRVGMFDPTFGKGYGEETDLCLRAGAAGYRHVLATRVFVYHAGSASMIAANVIRTGEATVKRHERMVTQRYPEFGALVNNFIVSGVMETMGNNLSKRYIVRESGLRPSIAIVIHEDPFASVEDDATRHVRDLIRELGQDFAFYILTPEAAKVRVSGYVDGIVTTFAVNSDDFASLLVDLHPSIVHIHQLRLFPSSFIDALVDWQGPKIYTVHDYYGVCPQYNLVGYRQIYCGVPEPEECDRCARTLFGTGYSTPAAQRRLFQRLVDSVTTVLAPSNSALEVFRKAITVPEEKARILPHPVVAHKYNPASKRLLARLPMSTSGEPDENGSGAGALSLRSQGAKEARPEARELLRLKEAQLRVAVIGYHAPDHGAALVQRIVTACSDAPITFVVFGDIGRVVEDSKNIVTTGQYDREQVTDLIKQYAVDVVIVASNWPETYCYTLSDAWMAGVPVIVGPFGALAERVAESGAGVVVPEYRTQSFVAAVRELLNDERQRTRLKQAAAAVRPRQDYGDYRDLYRTHVSHSPTATRFFSSYVEQVVTHTNVVVGQIPIIARLVSIRKRVFPVGSVREKGYLWLHDRLSQGRPSRTAAGADLREA